MGHAPLHRRLRSNAPHWLHLLGITFGSKFDRTSGRVRRLLGKWLRVSVKLNKLLLECIVVRVRYQCFDVNRLSNDQLCGYQHRSKV